MWKDNMIHQFLKFKILWEKMMKNTSACAEFNNSISLTYSKSKTWQGYTIWGIPKLIASKKLINFQGRKKKANQLGNIKNGRTRRAYVNPSSRKSKSHLTKLSSKVHTTHAPNDLRVNRGSGRKTQLYARTKKQFTSNRVLELYQHKTLKNILLSNTEHLMGMSRV